MTTEQNRYQDKEIREIRNSIKVINGEMGRIEKDIKGIEIKITKIENDTDWLKKHFWIVVYASVAALISAIFGLL